jgi:hypothetical protein
VPTHHELEQLYEQWEGDPYALPEGAEDHLGDNPRLCERIFASAHEAFTVGLFLGSRRNLTGSDIPTFTEIMGLPWGDLSAAILGVKDSLKLLMLLTSGEFLRWERDLADTYPSEYELPVEHAQSLPIEERFAHVARLIRSLAMDYGLRTDYALPPEEIREKIGEISPGSPAYILTLLDDLSLKTASRNSGQDQQRPDAGAP